MKRHICFLLAIFLVLAAFSPISASAASYAVSETDFSITIDENFWYVFTRDNLENNPELDDYGVSYEDMYSYLNDDNIYLYGSLVYEDGECFELLAIKEKTDSEMVNLSNYSDAMVHIFAKSAANGLGAEDYLIVKNNYTFVKVEYTSSNFYIVQFITLVNKDYYTFAFRSKSPFTANEYAEMKLIVDSIVFDVDTSLEEGIQTSFWEIITDSFTEGLIIDVIVGAVAGGIAGLVIAIVLKKKKKKKAMSKETVEAPPVENEKE